VGTGAEFSQGEGVAPRPPLRTASGSKRAYNAMHWPVSVVL